MTNDLPRITDILESYKNVVTPSVYEKLCIDVKTAFNERDAFWSTLCHKLRLQLDEAKGALETQLTVNEQQHQQLCELLTVNRRCGLMIDHLMEELNDTQ
jgi:hypothetical protein